ncbi:3-dehydroquinate synthase [Bacillus mesophilus]|uniref:3-dehydroquinate synthase n=1 Tax=Bacillus mesophilus TaxID=1808955 RepID=A0A6M0Q4A8_9BACI|nr:3-dehydroquinate synthase [Bacillus mesophilus]MBM7661250.1 3-dehydroquinate synthase [Bacillus mesophilus]NEY71225.1 3-dehydroquinate synthase [Bacillus mesophilus]
MTQLLIQTNSREYPLLIGTGLFQQKEILDDVLKNVPSSILIITDDTIAPLYLQDVEEALGEYTVVSSKSIPSGEKSKSVEMFYDCQTFAMEKGLDRNSLILALGGGVVGDLAGFVAATFMRGIRFIQAPTSLLAHDSAVGGKVAINHHLGKNSIGAFYQPEAVLYDLSFLQSLPEDEWRAGFAELIKHSLIWDKEFYPWLREEVPNMDKLKGPILKVALKRAIQVKADVVNQDEKETGIRAYLNFGHTLAHGLESELGYGNISHGDAVAIGMIFAMKVSEKVLHVSLPVKELQDWFDAIGYPQFPTTISVQSLLAKMKKDKKAIKGSIRMCLMNEIGSLTIQEVEDRILLEVLQQYVREG